MVQLDFSIANPFQNIKKKKEILLTEFLDLSSKNIINREDVRDLKNTVIRTYHQQNEISMLPNNTSLLLILDQG